MAQSIVAKFVNPFHSVAWQFRTTVADKTADVINPSIDLGFASMWALLFKLKVKASGGAQSFEFEMADALAGTGNVNSVAAAVFASTVLGTRFIMGWGDRSQQYLTINATIGTSVTFDCEIFGTPVV